MEIGITVGFAAVAVIFFFCWLSVRHSIKEIVEELKETMSSDTNTLISISTYDPYIREPAGELNEQLLLLKSERRKYQSGDAQLKIAVANISYDIRTPLTAICSYLDLLEETQKSDVVTDYLKIIRGRTENLTELTEELFQYSVVASQSNDMVREDTVINEVIEESIAAFYAALKNRNISPVIQITEQKIIRKIDRRALSRVFSNVINNALKYSDGDLEIELNDQGEVFFTNRAPELNEVLAGKLFDRFYTVETSRKSTGLGLTIARTLMEQMQGSIVAEYLNGRLIICIHFLAN